MIHLKRNDTNPYFNIAAEEYIFRNFDTDIFMLWINEPSVVLGKHQNAFSEIDHNYISKEKIPVIRRISGGGTVYHDLGNLNYTLIFNRDSAAQVDYTKNTRGIIEALKSLGLNAELRDKSNVTVNGVKVSGNSEHIFKNKILHHGTLLFSADINKLESIKGNKLENFKDKAVKSIRKDVINISEILEKKMTINEFSDYIYSFLFHFYNAQKSVSLSNTDRGKINTLVEDKYTKWEWNYGYSPSFTVSKDLIFDNKTHHFELGVKSGIIIETNYSGSFEALVHILENLKETPYNPYFMQKRIINNNFAEQVPGLLVKTIIQELF